MQRVLDFTLNGEIIEGFSKQRFGMNGFAFLKITLEEKRMEWRSMRIENQGQWRITATL